MQSPLVEGRRFLICHSIIHDIMGSTVVTLDLAEYLRDAGADVLVYAAYVGTPADEIFSDRGIDVVDDEGVKGLSFAEFDVVWVNSQVLPVAMLDQLADPPPGSMPAFVFLHMSPLPIAPDEHPYIIGLEERLASLSLFNSVESRTALVAYFDQSPAVALYPNPAPIAFSRVRPITRPSPQKVLVVTNHAAPELMEAKQVLRERGLDVRHVGRAVGDQTLITADLVGGADVVVTIGKTVQYCLVAGVPVFVYDKHGGYGYLDDERLDHAATHNFSGREGRRLTAEQIAEEILAGYSTAVAFHAQRREQLVETYSIDRVVPRVLEELVVREIAPLEPRLLKAVRSAETFGARFYRYWGRITNDTRRIERIERDLQEARDAHEVARRRHESDEVTITGLHAEIERLHGTWTFRVGRVVVRPASAVARALRSLLPGR
ncbi:hypothetical protein ACHAAC_16905 [Aeromicrobium sp. CF4.19]|uniref:hypothetical protein n=1 Tax=Aeromicrobium sp. CF4.19 TaxID=3373082 RepID=UPI003EE64EC4